MTIKDFERLRGDLDDLQQLRRGHVRISSMEGAVPGLLYGAIREFEKKYPGITFEIVIGGSETQVGALVREECDLSIAFNTSPHPEIAIESSFADPVCAIVHPSHAFARRRTLRLADLVSQRIAMLDRTFVTRTLMESALASEGLTLPAVITINHIGHAVTYAATNMGIAFAPWHIVQNQVKAGLLKAIPMQHPILGSSKTSLCRHRTRPTTRPALAFIDVLRKHFAAIGAGGHQRTSRIR
jgi:DNA-binding transcriptional LysR family regulator